MLGETGRNVFRVSQEVTEDYNVYLVRFGEVHPFWQRKTGEDCYFGDGLILHCCTEDLNASWTIRVSYIGSNIQRKDIPAPVTPVKSNLIVFSIGRGSQRFVDPD